MERTIIPLEITLISAKDLKDVGHFFKMDVYVAVTISGDPRTEQRSPVDRDGGTSPKWNHSMNFTVDESLANTNLLNLIFQLRSDRVLRGDKHIGEVHVPIKELIDNAEDYQLATTVSYPVRNPSGKAKGKLKFSYKFGAVHATPLVAPHAHTGTYPTYPPPVVDAGPQPPPFPPPQDSFFTCPSPPVAYPPHPDPHGHSSTNSTYPPPPFVGVPYSPVDAGVYPPPVPPVWHPKIGHNCTYPPPVVAEPYTPAVPGPYSQPPPAGYPPTASFVAEGYGNHECGGNPPRAAAPLPQPPAGYPPIGQGYGYRSTSTATASSTTAAT